MAPEKTILVRGGRVMERTPLAGSDDDGLVFRIRPGQASQLEAWKRTVDEKEAKEQVRTGRFFGGSRLKKEMLQSVQDSLECGDPRPYRGAIGGAYRYCFIPTALGCVVEVRSIDRCCAVLECPSCRLVRTRVDF